jgi:WD40 repeat protein
MKERPQEPVARPPHVDAPSPGDSRQDLVVRGSPARCPYCHDRLSEDWVACESCVAKHHRGCWDEHGRCATCGGSESLRPVKAAAKRRVAKVVIVVAALVALFLGGRELARTPMVTGITTPQRTTHEAASLLQSSDVPLVATLGEVSADRWVYSVACTPDGSRMLTGCDGVLTLWDVPSAKVVRTYPLPKKGFETARTAPDFRRAVISINDRLLLLDLESGELVTLEQIPEDPMGQQCEACDAAFTLDGKHLLVGGGGGLDFWDLPSKKKLWSTKRGDEFIGYESCVRMFPDGERALVGGHYGLRVVRLSDGKDLMLLDAQGADPWVYGAGLSPDSKKLISRPGCSTSMRVRYLPGGRGAVSIDESGVVSFWNTEANESPLCAREWIRLNTAPGLDPTPTSLALAPDGRRVFVGTSQGTVLVYELTDRMLQGFW